MTRLLKSRSSKRGAPPGTLVHIGAPRLAAPEVTLFSYDGESFSELSLDPAAATVPPPGGEETTWLNVEGVSMVELLRGIGDRYALHPLVLEDLVNTDQRPKIEDYGDYLYLVVKGIDIDDEGAMTVEQVSLVLGRGWLLTVQEGLRGDPFAPVRERLRGGKGRLRTAGADYLAYALLDALIDQYFAVLEQLDERVEKLEEEVVTAPTRFTVRKIHRLRQQMILFRRSVWPLRELFAALARRESDLVGEGTLVYLRDLYDHTVQIIETVEATREMLSGMLDIYLSSEANRTNEVMKVLTVYATIFMPLTFIVGLYGMNFRYMPELEWRWGYPAVLLLMALLALGMMIYFRRKKWLGGNTRQSLKQH